MENNQPTTIDAVTTSPIANWSESETLFLINCYDVWSATPPRGCQCGDPTPAADVA
jgi:hypothetical protein